MRITKPEDKKKMKPDEIISQYLGEVEVTPISEIESCKEKWYKDRLIERRNREMSSDKYRYFTHSGPAKNLARYLFEDCVIAYVKDLFGAMFIIKSKQKYFAFVCRSKDFYLGGMGYSLMDTSLKTAIEMIEKLPEKYKNDKEHFQILDADQFQRLNNFILVEAIAE